MLADDAADVLQVLKVPTADVTGDSMGGTTTMFMAIRHPDRVRKQIFVSRTSRRDGWYPELARSFAEWKPEMFAGTPLEAEYKRQSPTQEAFPMLITELREMDTANFDRSDEAIRSIDDKTIIIVGDADGMQLELPSNCSNCAAAAASSSHAGLHNGSATHQARHSARDYAYRHAG